MKLNKKGFMLAEVTIVATLAATVMLALYASSVKMINAYKERENYHDVETIYATGYIYDFLVSANCGYNLYSANIYTGNIDSEQISSNNSIDKYISDILNNSATRFNKKTFSGYGTADEYLDNLLGSNGYNVTDIRFISSKGSDVNTLIDRVDNRAFKRYLKNYVKNNVSCEDSDVNCDKYILIVERNVGSEYYYYSIEV